MHSTNPLPKKVSSLHDDKYFRHWNLRTAPCKLLTWYHQSCCFEGKKIPTEGLILRYYNFANISAIYSKISGIIIFIPDPDFFPMTLHSLCYYIKFFVHIHTTILYIKKLEFHSTQIIWIQTCSERYMHTNDAKIFSHHISLLFVTGKLMKEV